jgi:predicted nuclease of restriction endonuclease-like (RecB) superfamily
MNQEPTENQPSEVLPLPGDEESVVLSLFDRVTAILDESRASVVRAVNSRMVLAYWLIGREIVLAVQGGENRAKYGKAILGGLSLRLTQRYGDGFSEPSLRAYRQFFQTYADREIRIRSTAGSELTATICSPPGSEFANPVAHPATGDKFPLESPFLANLSWSHYRLIMRVETADAREFYEAEAATAGWTKRELERQIHSFYYQRLLSSQDRQGMILEQRQSISKFDPTSILKSSTVLEFLGIPASQRLHESELEQAIMDNLQTFLLELGRGFSFVARQKRLVFEDDEFYVDLVFYNFILKCFVLIDLKIGKLTHQDVGQMDSYVRLYEDLHKVAGDNPTIGLILCSEKNETIARYSVLKESQQLFATKYRLYLPTEEELAKELKREILALAEASAERESRDAE